MKSIEPYDIWYVPEYPLEIANDVQDWGYDSRPWLKGLQADIVKFGLVNPIILRGVQTQYGLNRVWCMRQAGLTHAKAIVFLHLPARVADQAVLVPREDLQSYFPEGRIVARPRGLRLYDVRDPREVWMVT